MRKYKECEGCFLKDQYCFVHLYQMKDSKACPCSICLVKITCRDEGKYGCPIRGKYIWTLKNRLREKGIQDIGKKEQLKSINDAVMEIIKEESTNFYNKEFPKDDER